MQSIIYILFYKQFYYLMAHNLESVVLSKIRNIPQVVCFCFFKLYYAMLRKQSIKDALFSQIVQ